MRIIIDMSSPESKKKNDEEDLSELQPAMRKLAIHPSTMRELVLRPSTGSELNMCLQLPHHNFRVERLRYQIYHQMERFMRYFLQQPSAHIRRITVENAVIFKLQYSERVELVEVIVSGRDRDSPNFKWTLLSKEFLRMVDDIHINRIDNFLSLSSLLNKDSVIQGLGAIETGDTEPDIEVEKILDPNERKTSLQELKKRAAYLRKRLDEPCNSDIASKLQQELNQILMRQEDWQHKEILHDDYPKANLSTDQEYDETQLSFPRLDEMDANYLSSDEFDDMLAFDSGIVKKDITTDNVQLDQSIKLEQENFTRCKQEVLRVCHTKGGEITMANVMENKPSSSAAQFFMASLMLASEKKLQIENKGQKAEPTTIDQLVMKIRRKS